MMFDWEATVHRSSTRSHSNRLAGDVGGNELDRVGPGGDCGLGESDQPPAELDPDRLRLP